MAFTILSAEDIESYEQDARSNDEERLAELNEFLAANVYAAKISDKNCAQTYDKTIKKHNLALRVKFRPATKKRTQSATLVYNDAARTTVENTEQ